MEELRLECARRHTDEMVIYEVGSSCNFVQFDANDQSGDTVSIVLDVASARQLHEWLGRYLENSNGK